MKTITIAGNVGKDAEHKSVNGNEICSFSVAVDDGWGENKTTMWFDVSRWGKGAQGLANALVKGSKVAVAGELSAREHNGKTYFQVRADKVTIQSTPNSGAPRQQRQAEPATGGGAGNYGNRGGSFADDLSDDIPFVTCESVW